MSIYPSEWFHGPLGQYLLERERAVVDRMVDDVFGYNAIQLGLPEIDWLRNNRIPRHFHIDPGSGAQLRADFDFLPLDSQSVDLAVLPHVLEFAERPHQVLREIERTLIPEGQVVVVGFNPWSLWGACRLKRRRDGEFPWNGEFISLARLKDWFALLGLELEEGRFACYAPPFARENWRSRFDFMEPAGDRWWAVAGGVYIVKARKRVHGMRLIEPHWRDKLRSRRALAPLIQKRMEKEPE